MEFFSYIAVLLTICFILFRIFTRSQKPQASPCSAVSFLQDHAVVIGGGVSGILAAAALRTQFKHITILEKGNYQESLRPRKNVPQGNMVPCPQ